MDLVGVHAVIAFRQILLQQQGVVVLLHKIAVGVPLAELADADVHHTEHAGKGHHRRRHALGKAAVCPPFLADQTVEQQSAQAKAQHHEILAGVLEHTQRPGAGVVVQHGHQCKGQRSQHDPAKAPGRGVQIGVVIFQRIHGHRRKDEHRHIVPAGIVAGVESVECAVQDGHQRAHGAHRHNALFAVAMAGTPVGQRTCQTAQGQIGRHAGPLDDAFRPDGGQVGRIRRHHPAEQDGQILLHLAVGQKAPSGRKVDGARVLQQAQHRRDQQQAAHGHTQQAFKRQLHKPLHGQAVVAGSELAHKVDGQEHHLPGKKEVVVEQVHRRPEGKQPVTLVVHGLVQRPQQIREQRHHIHKVVEEHVVHRKAGQCIQAGTQHGVIPVFDVALQVQVRTAARHAELEHQQRHHQVGQPPLREQ